jgi:peptide/nickel transport system permease protein
MLILLFGFSFIGPTMHNLSFIWYETEQDKPLDGVYGNTSWTEYEFVGEDGNTYIIYDIVQDKLTINKYASCFSSTTVYKLDKNSQYVLDENGNQIVIQKYHILGTDKNGYDIFSRLMYGGRISLTLGFVVVFLETLIGVILGGLAGYFGKWVDQIIMRIVDVFYCLPTFPILLIASSLLDAYNIEGNIRIYYLMIILTIFGWAGTARLVRGQILSLREQEFMLAADALGLPTWRKIFKHLIPNVMPQLIVTMTLGLGSVILTEASMSFLGLGLTYPAAAWGSQINMAVMDPDILKYYFNIWGSAGICIILAILAFNFIGDGLRDALDPKMKR